MGRRTLSDPNHSTAELLSWSEIRLQNNCSAANPSNQVHVYVARGSVLKVYSFLS